MKVTPITLVTGFLGSGKSTLINCIIKKYPKKKFGLIVNEFGDVNLESQIIETTKEKIVELSNGCMCCVVRGDIIDAVEQMLGKVDYIIVEASGLSDPVPIAQTFLGHQLSKKARLDAILCVADAVNFGKNLDNFAITSSQLKSADIVLLSKTSEVKETNIQHIKEFVTEMLGEVSLFELTDDFDLNVIIDTSEFDHSEIGEMEIIEHKEEDHKHADHECHDEHCTHEHHTHEHVDTIFYKTKTPLDYKKFSEFIFGLKENIVRGKGFANFGESVPAPGKYILQFVGARKQMLLKEWKSDEEKQSAMVFIGKKLNEKKIMDGLKKCEI